MDTKPPLIVRLLPRRALSRFTGWWARRRMPGFLLRPMLRAYAKRYGANLDESERPLEDFRSFTDFFTRTLVKGARPMPEDPSTLACPCDSAVSVSGTVTNGMLLQVKGHHYSLADLLGDADAAATFEGGSYVVLYLAPGDYHRYHWPLDGEIATVRHLRGDLWPVNERSVASVEGLFAANERVACLGTTSAGHAFAYVPVGALNVGSIKLAFHDVRTNRGGRVRAERWPVSARGARGDEFGLFELGSTVVLVLSKAAGTIEAPAPGTKVRLGEALGRVAT